MKKLINEIIKIIKEEYKFILLLFLISIISLYPLDYYITIGGGIKDIGSRVKIEESYKEKGSFNIVYVSQLNGTVITYLLSYIVPNWEKQKISDYAYNEEEDIKDIEYRDKIELEASTSNAIYNAYTLANKEINPKSKQFLILAKFKEYKNDFEIGDEILSIENKSLNKLEEYKELINSHNVDDKLNIKLKRNNKEIDIQAKIYKEKKSERKILGLYLSELNKYETNPKVKVKFAKNEEGPSGGLITALSIYNKLTKEDITKGKTIAGTGTMNQDGSVGVIGGIKFKILGANKKADIFLVPEGNYKEALKVKKENKLKIKLIKVKSLKDAINKLNKIK